VTLRISGLDLALWMTLPQLKDETADRGGTPLSSWIALAGDEFNLLDGGAFRVAGQEPIRLLMLPVTTRSEGSVR